MIVVISILALLFSLLLPAIQTSREVARQAQCQNNLRQIAIAVSMYEAEWKVYPDAWNHKLALLPSLGESSLYRLYNPAATSEMDALRGIRDKVLEIFLCPSDGASSRIQIDETVGASNYVACTGTGLLRNGFDGVFTLHSSPYPDAFPSRPIGSGQIRDGLSQTIAMSESLHADLTFARLRTLWITPSTYAGATGLQALATFCDSIPQEPTAFGWSGVRDRKGVPWTNGDFGCGSYNHVLTPNRPSCLNGGSPAFGVHTANSYHRNGVVSQFADGSVKIISNKIDQRIWLDLGSRSDNRTASSF